MNVMSDSEHNAELADVKSVKELRKQYVTRGLSGLINLGNTCYMNSTLQCLSATDLLVSYFRSPASGFKKHLEEGTRAILTKDDYRHRDRAKVLEEKCKNTLSYVFRNLIVVMWGENRKIEPKTFKMILGEKKKTFKGSDQNDSQECLSFTIDQIHEETKTDVHVELVNLPPAVLEYMRQREIYTTKINTGKYSIEDKIRYKEEYDEYRNTHLKEDAILRGLMFWQKFLKKNHSVIVDIFMGLYFSEVVCSNCNEHNFSYDPFNIINLPINKVDNGASLSECLERYFSSEVLTDKDQYYCEKCKGKYDASKKMALWHAPPRLIIQLKRFTNSGSKIEKRINYPLTGLDMKPFFSVHNPTEGEKIYDLYAVSHHSGSLMFGHYVAYAKNPVNDKWYLFDDTNVMHIDDDKIEERIVSSGAYVLFYKKRC